MLAANRTDSVIGRIIFLIISIHTMNDINATGVPWGTKWASICKVLFIHPNSMNEIHNGRAKVKVKIKCLEEVKINGNKPSELLNKMKIKIEIGIIVIPEDFIGPNNILNSLWSVLIIKRNIILIREGINQ